MKRLVSGHAMHTTAVCRRLARCLTRSLERTATPLRSSRVAGFGDAPWLSGVAGVTTAGRLSLSSVVPGRHNNFLLTDWGGEVGSRRVQKIMAGFWQQWAGAAPCDVLHRETGGTVPTSPSGARTFLSAATSEYPARPAVHTRVHFQRCGGQECPRARRRPFPARLNANLHCARSLPLQDFAIRIPPRAFPLGRGVSGMATDPCSLSRGASGRATDPCLLSRGASGVATDPCLLSRGASGRATDQCLLSRGASRRISKCRFLSSSAYFRRFNGLFMGIWPLPSSVRSAMFIAYDIRNTPQAPSGAAYLGFNACQTTFAALTAMPLLTELVSAKDDFSIDMALLTELCRKPTSISFAVPQPLTTNC